MYYKEKKVSIISLALCAVAITFVTLALVFATRNAANVKASIIEGTTVESLAYAKNYGLQEIQQIANQAFVNNYLKYYENKIDITSFENTVKAEILKEVPKYQMDRYDVFVYNDGVLVQYK